MKEKINLKGNRKIAFILAVIMLIAVIAPLKGVKAENEPTYSISLGDGSFEKSTKLRRCKFRWNCYKKRWFFANEI